MIKKTLGILFTVILLISCTKNNNFTDTSKYGLTVSVEDFFDYTVICSDFDEKIVMDKNTSILYYYRVKGSGHSITVIIDADGNPLTLSKWKEKRN